MDRVQVDKTGHFAAADYASQIKCPVAHECSTSAVTGDCNAGTYSLHGTSTCTESDFVFE